MNDNQLINPYENIKKKEARIGANKLFNEAEISNNQDLKLKNYDEAIKLNPDFAEPYNNRGIIKLQRNEYTNAIKDFETALKINPELSTTRYNLALAYYANGNYNKSAFIMDEYLKSITYVIEKKSKMDKINKFLFPNAYLENGATRSQIYDKQEKNKTEESKYFQAQMVKANSLLLTGNLQDAKKIYNQQYKTVSAYWLGHSYLLINNQEYKKCIKELEYFLAYHFKKENYNGMEYEVITNDSTINAYIYHNIALSEYLKGDYINAYKSIRKAKYLSFKDNWINLYTKNVVLENLIKSKITQTEEFKTDKEYKKFYERNTFSDENIEPTQMINLFSM